jgi:hypothetical protein
LSVWSALRSHKKKRTGAKSQLSTAREAEKRWCYSSVDNLAASSVWDLSMEAEE